MLINKDVHTWDLIGWQHSHQQIRSLVRKSLLMNLDFNMDLFLETQALVQTFAQYTLMTKFGGHKCPGRALQRRMSPLGHGPLTRCVKMWIAHAPGMPPPRVSDPVMHHGTCITHVPWCMPGSLTSGFLWSRWRENVPSIPGVRVTPNFTYLVRGPLWSYSSC